MKQSQVEELINESMDLLYFLVLNSLFNRFNFSCLLFILWYSTYCVNY